MNMPEHDAIGYAEAGNEVCDTETSGRLGAVDGSGNEPSVTLRVKRNK